MDNDFDAENFIIEVDAYTDDWEGEIEVSDKALKSYLTYPCYAPEQGWQCTTNNKRYGMLYNSIDRMFLTADTITSIKTPVNNILKSNGKATFGEKEGGPEIRKKICDPQYLSDNKLNYSWKAFARVYYWIGNMMPVIKNFNAGKCDNWNFKVNHFNECYQPLDNSDSVFTQQERINRLWIKAMEKYFENFNGFITQNYLIDCVDKKSNVKNGLEFNEENETSWIIQNTKIIIQRSYRICKQKMGEFNKRDEKNIRDIFKEVFKDIDIDKNDYLNLF